MYVIFCPVKAEIIDFPNINDGAVYGAAKHCMDTFIRMEPKRTNFIVIFEKIQISPKRAAPLTAPFISRFFFSTIITTF